MIKVTRAHVLMAVDRLDVEFYCCHALAAALSGHPYMSAHTGFGHMAAAERFLAPLLDADGITSDGYWLSVTRRTPIEMSRADWLKKVAASTPG